MLLNNCEMSVSQSCRPVLSLSEFIPSSQPDLGAFIFQICKLGVGAGWVAERCFNTDELLAGWHVAPDLSPEPAVRVAAAWGWGLELHSPRSRECAGQGKSWRRQSSRQATPPPALPHYEQHPNSLWKAVCMTVKIFNLGRRLLEFKAALALISCLTSGMLLNLSVLSSHPLQCPSIPPVCKPWIIIALAS